VGNTAVKRNLAEKSFDCKKLSRQLALFCENFTLKRHNRHLRLVIPQEWTPFPFTGFEVMAPLSEYSTGCIILMYL